jgi:hypothetical protein
MRRTFIRRERSKQAAKTVPGKGKARAITEELIDDTPVSEWSESEAFVVCLVLSTSAHGYLQ